MHLDKRKMKNEVLLKLMDKMQMKDERLKNSDICIIYL